MEDSGGRVFRRHLELAQRILDLASARGWVPGARLAEQALATQCGVSRTPVRKALGFLAARGLVAIDEDGGYVLAADPVTQPRLEADEGGGTEVELYHAVLRDVQAGRIAGAQTVASLRHRYQANRKTVQNVLQKLSDDDFAMRGGGQQWQFSVLVPGGEAGAKSMEFRLALEPLALSLPGYSRDLGALIGLKQAMLALKSMPEAEFGRKLFERTDVDFHMAVAKGCGNPFLAQALLAHHRQRQALGLSPHVQNRRLMASNEEHVMILEQMERGQLELAADLMRVHLRQSQAVRPRLAGRGVPASFAGG